MRGINNDDARYDPNGAGSLTYALTLPAGLICDLPTLALTGTPQARHETTQQNKPGFTRNSGFWFFAKTKRASVTGTESREQMKLRNVPLVIHVRALPLRRSTRAFPSHRRPAVCVPRLSPFWGGLLTSCLSPLTFDGGLPYASHLRSSVSIRGRACLFETCNCNF